LIKYRTGSQLDLNLLYILIRILNYKQARKYINK
jgi:hypothetical protein